MLKKIIFKINKSVITQKTSSLQKRGDILISYTTLPFLEPKKISSHSNRWECQEITRIFNDRGFNVDIIDHTNKKFIPKKKYRYCLDISDNLERLDGYLNKDCIKIFHITGAHWLFQNQAEYQRLLDIQTRRKVTLKPRRICEPSLNIEMADISTILGNEFTIKTYEYANKKIIPIPITGTHTYPSPENKDFNKIRKNFIWIGGAGMAHKGLDLVLEAFDQMPEYQLIILGKKDDDFAEAYYQELYKTKNIKYLGMVDLGSKDTIEILNNSLGVIFPSCSEGGGGSVINSMHSGLIPIVSYEASVNVEKFGTILKENSIEEIIKEVKELSNKNPEDLKLRAIEAWQYANKYHSRENFIKNYDNFVGELIKKYE